jgi:hypothetical protein
VDDAIVPKRAFQPRQPIADDQAHKPLPRADPVRPGLARQAAVFTANNTLGDSLGQQLAGLVVRANTILEVLDDLGLVAGQHRAVLGGRPGLVFRAVGAARFAGARVDRFAGDELAIVLLPAFESQDKGRTIDMLVERLFCRKQSSLALAEDKCVPAKVMQLLGTEVLGFLRDVRIERLPFQEGEIIQKALRRAGAAPPQGGEIHA